jgi:hypothetical protein
MCTSIAGACKHLVPWDAATNFVRLAVPFLEGDGDRWR